MQFIKQSVTLPIKQIDKNVCDENYYKHCKLLPNSTRCIICGPSASGKTNLLMNILLHPNGLKFCNVYIFSKSFFQPKYKYLEQIICKVPQIKLYKFNSNEDMPEAAEVQNNSVIIFDDVMCEPQGTIQNFFSMGRHKLLDVFYLAQTFAKIPKHLVRDNCNLIVVFSQDALNLKHIYEDYVNADMTFEKFKNMCAECWNNKEHGFLTICMENKKNDGKYRRGLDEYIIV